MEPATILDAGKQADFHIKEVEGLRSEINFYSQEVRFMERAAIIGPVTVYSWLAVQERLENTPVAIMAWWLPLVLVCFIWRRKCHADNSIMRIASYLRKIEDHVALRSLGGWENYVQQMRTNPATKWRKFGFTYWIGVFAFCFVVPAIATINKIVTVAVLGIPVQR